MDNARLKWFRVVEETTVRTTEEVVAHSREEAIDRFRATRVPFLSEVEKDIWTEELEDVQLYRPSGFD